MCIWCSVVLVSVNMRSSYEQLRCLRRGLTVLISPRSGPRTLEQLQVLHIPWFFAISILSWLLIIFFFRFLRSLGACKRCVLPRRGGLGSDHGLMMEFTGSMGMFSLFLY